MSKHIFKYFFPISEWVQSYSKQDFFCDLIAGSIVAIVLIPQSMAYAMLAGLPPQLGLYSSVVPLLIYTLMGSSRALAIGPVGLVSLMTGATIAKLNLTTEAEYIAASVTLAILSGSILIFIRLVKLSAITKFLSHPVMSGFTSAAAVIIILSQLKHILGVNIDPGKSPAGIVSDLYAQLDAFNIIALYIGGIGIIILLIMKNSLTKWLNQRSFATYAARNAISKSGPFLLVASGILLTWFFKFHEHNGLSIVGEIPRGLPEFHLPTFDWVLWKQLLPSATIMAIIGFFESVSVAKSLASRKRQRIDSDQEALALGFSNIGAALSGGMPVAGGFARSIVNFTSGATSPLAGLISGFLVALSLIFLMDIIYFLPKAVLAAIICVAVTGLIDYHAMKEAWVYSKSDATALIITFVGVIMFGIEQGILAGVLFSIGQYLHRSSKPHIAVVGRVGNTEHYRNLERHQVITHDNVLLIRIDESLYFANTNYLEVNIINLLADNPKVTDVVIICSAVNVIDTSALQSLETIAFLLKKAKIDLHYAEVKGPIMDRLLKSDFLETICTGNVYLSTHDAMLDLIEKIEKRKKAMEPDKPKEAA